MNFRTYLVSKSGISTFHFHYSIYSNPDFEFKKKKKKHLFSYLIIFGKLFLLEHLIHSSETPYLTINYVTPTQQINIQQLIL